MKRYVFILALGLGLAAVILYLMRKDRSGENAQGAARSTTGTAPLKPGSLDGSIATPGSTPLTDGRQAAQPAPLKPAQDPVSAPVSAVPGKDGAAPVASESQAARQHYMERQEAKLAYARTSLAYALNIRGQSNPEIWFDLAVAPNVDQAKLNASGPQKEAREVLAEFAKAFQTKLKEVHGQQALDVPPNENYVDLAAHEDVETRMWQEVDAWIPQVTCEGRLQQIFGPPVKGTAYLSVENFQ